MKFFYTPFHVPGIGARSSIRERATSRLLSPWIGMTLALAASGCAVQLFDEIEDGTTRNVCESNSDCSGGSCSEGMCQRSGTDLPALLLAITPPAETSVIAGATFTSVIEQFERGPTDYVIALGHLASLRGTIKAQPLSGAACVAPDDESRGTELGIATDGSLPARLTLIPRARLLGLPSPSLTTVVDQIGVDPAEVGQTSYRLTMGAPAGSYDIYVEPLHSHEGCVRPPYLVVDETLQAGNIPFTLDLPAPEILGVTVRYPQVSDDLKGWILDIVDRDSGRLLSNRAVLSDPTAGEVGLEYGLTLAFSRVDGERAAATELVRLSPPDDVVAPTVYVERSVVDLFQDGTGLIDQVTDLADPVSFRARVALAGLTTPAPATVTLIATELKSTGPGTVAAFSRIVDTDEEGFFETELLPGVYSMLVEPLNSDQARVVGELTVSDASSTQNGKTIEVYPRGVLAGRLVSFNGARVAGAPLWAEAVPVDVNANVLKVAQSLLAIPGVAFGMGTDAEGGFELLADPGTFHVSARPDPSTGFAWGIRMGVQVQGENISLGRIELSLPVVVRGRLTSEDTGDVVPEALIRVYALLKDGTPVSRAEEADSAVAVGESRVDSKGEFRLLLPSTFK